tara:strand:- start:6261 stop:7103 length:843 start_codon:yes stop_codon:yes gene_type:complete
MNLFYNKTTSTWVKDTDIKKALDNLSIDDYDTIYVHSGLTFGIPNLEIKRRDILRNIIEIFMNYHFNCICFPTFTFSFCNYKDFDLFSSKTKMGALNEYFRNQEGVIRSKDPLLSHAVYGSEKIINNLGNQSIGNNSTFEHIYNEKNVAFLFFGANLHECFTYMHYLEWIKKVDFRYNRKFKGKILNKDKVEEAEYELFVRYKNVTPSIKNGILYEETLKEKNLMKCENLGLGNIALVDKDKATDLYLDFLKKDKYFFIEGKFNKSDTSKEFKGGNIVSL